MHFILNMNLIFLFALLVGNSMAFDGCYSGGNTWEELGDDAAISDAFHRLCDKMSGNFKIGDNVSQAKVWMAQSFKGRP